MIYDPDSFSGKGEYTWRPGGLAEYKSGEINTYDQGLRVYERVWMLELIASQELHWHRHGNGTVDPDLSFGIGEESIGKKPGMEPKFGSVLTSLHVRRNSKCQRILLFEQRSRKRLARCRREDT